VPLPHTDVLPRDSVVDLTLEIAPEDHRARLADLTERLGPAGSEKWDLGAARAQEPLWVPARATLAGMVLEDARVRFAGHASLLGPWSSGRLKLPLHLEFPTPIDGFAELHVVPGYRDRSLLREKLALEVLGGAGVPVVRAALCRVTLDLGEGPFYGGLYTLLESPTDRFLVERFGAAGGNLYEAAGKGAEWRRPEPAGFVPRAGDDPDGAEITAAIGALLADRTDRDGWRASLEERLDVDCFLRWLAANTVLGNRDTYGHKSHNYWLYADPTHDGRLAWIPLDLGSAFTARGGRMSLLHEREWRGWPLIGLLMTDETYRAAYLEHVKAVLAGPFAEDALHARIDALHALAAPHVVGSDGEQAPYTLLQGPAHFDRGVAKIKVWVNRRHHRIREEFIDLFVDWAKEQADSWRQG
jgi:hypothetical protein